MTSIDTILTDLAEGRVTDAEVLAMGYSRDVWKGYEVVRGSAPAVVAAYWRILKAMPAVAAVPYREAIPQAECAAFYRGMDSALDGE